MEIVATLRALEHFYEEDVDVIVVSDSNYVVKCFQDRWWEGWLSRGWKNSQRQPVANRDLWEPLIALVRRRGGVTFEWVKGHSGDPMNDLVDALAVEESRKHSG
jgi:ribonuclease HI